MIGRFAPSALLALLISASTALAAERDSTLAEFMSLHSRGVDYELGRGVPQNYTEAAKSYLKAAELGYADAQNNLGKLYDSGLGVSQNYVQAYLWYRLAAKQGHGHALNNLLRLAPRMTSAELAEAQQLVRE